ncbi:Actin-related protein 10-like [Oopsacas minuta]|uniref:Actin-related protein 10-like n=1 Tax=Oopsacas minuta TaxID=111878 RepID=A0AAV7KHJ9_9METZ|nr:Actin-related protein 10-like [Oopsacas minuta]
MSKTGHSAMAKLRSIDKIVRSAPDTLILDIGTLHTKLGFDGDSAPRFIIPTRIHGRGLERDKILKIFPYKPSSEPNSARELELALYDMFSDLFYNHYQINPREYRVLILESVFNPSPLKESIAKCLFLSYQVHSILFFPHSIACLHSVGQEEGLVIDIGHTGTRITPISCSIVLLSLCRDIPGFGGEYMLNWLRFNLSKQASLVKVGTLERVDKKVEDVLTQEFLEDVRCRMCAVRCIDETRTPPDAHLNVPTDPSLLLCVPGELRHRVAECLFSIYPEEIDGFPLDLLPERTLSQEIAECFLKLPIDLRVPLSGNIVLAGGPTMLPGFKKRIMEEINLIFSKEHEGKLGSKVVFSIHMPIIHENILGWHGGSVVGACTQAFDARALKREQFVKKGWKVPDWCQLDPTDRPKLDYSRTSTNPQSSYSSRPGLRGMDPSQHKPATKDSISAFFNKLIT